MSQRAPRKRKEWVRPGAHRTPLSVAVKLDDEPMPWPEYELPRRGMFQSTLNGGTAPPVRRSGHPVREE